MTTNNILKLHALMSQFLGISHPFHPHTGTETSIIKIGDTNKYS